MLLFAFGHCLGGCAIPTASHQQPEETKCVLPEGTKLFVGDVLLQPPSLELGERNRIVALLSTCDNWHVSLTTITPGINTSEAANTFLLEVRIAGSATTAPDQDQAEKLRMLFTLTDLNSGKKILEQLTTVTDNQYVSENGRFIISNAHEALVEKGIKAGTKRLRKQCGCDK